MVPMVKSNAYWNASNSVPISLFLSGIILETYLCSLYSAYIEEMAFKALLRFLILTDFFSFLETTLEFIPILSEYLFNLF